MERGLLGNRSGRGVKHDHDGLPMNVEVRILDPRLPGWGFPHYGSAASAGLDLHASLDGPLVLGPGAPPVLISSGVAIRIGDPDWCGIVAARSGLGHRGLVLGNAIGVIDADYEGPCLISAWNRNDPRLGEAGAITIQPGDRIAQLLFVRVARPSFQVVEQFSEAGERKEGGFGSTGIGHAGGATR
jgi:dUTP pyrophosphatase